MKQIVCFFALTILLFGCDNNESLVDKNEPEPQIGLETYDETTVTPNHVATFEVEGMMCEKGCGSTIRKGLYETGGVSKVDILNFNEKDSINKIQVYFDSEKSTTEDMINVIGELADKRYAARLEKVTESTLSNTN